MAQLKGRDLTLSLNGNHMLYSSSCSIDIQQEMKEIQSTETKFNTKYGSKDFNANGYSWTLSADYVIESGDFTFPEIFGLYESSQMINITMGIWSDIASDKINAKGRYSGKAFITSLELNAGEINGAVTFSLQMQGTGVLTYTGQ